MNYEKREKERKENADLDKKAWALKRERDRRMEKLMRGDGRNPAPHFVQELEEIAELEKKLKKRREQVREAFAKAWLFSGLQAKVTKKNIELGILQTVLRHPSEEAPIATSSSLSKSTLDHFLVREGTCLLCKCAIKDTRRAVCDTCKERKELSQLIDHEKKKLETLTTEYHKVWKACMDCVHGNETRVRLCGTDSCPRFNYRAVTQTQYDLQKKRVAKLNYDW